MKKLLFFIVVIIFYLSPNYGQSPITMEKKLGGYMFYQDSQMLNMSQLVNIMQSNQEASIEIKKAKSSSAWSSVFACAGGFMIGWPLGTAIAGGNPEWAMAGIGAGLVVIAIPIASKATKQAKNAVNIYNNGLSANSIFNNIELKCHFTGNGIGLVLNF